MALVFNSTPGTVGFNAFCSVAEATDYATSKLNTAWPAMTTANKEATIIWASRQLSTLSWIGSKTEQTQPLAWPREDVPIEGTQSYYYENDSSEDYISYAHFDPATIPTPIKECCAELAIILSTEDVTADDNSQNLKSVKVDTIAIEYKNSASNQWLKSSIRDLIWKYLQNSSPYSAKTLRVG